MDDSGTTFLQWAINTCDYHLLDKLLDADDLSLESVDFSSLGSKEGCRGFGWVPKDNNYTCYPHSDLSPESFKKGKRKSKWTKREFINRVLAKKCEKSEGLSTPMD